MKTIYKRKAIALLVCTIIPMLQGCTYDDKPKKTQNSSPTYLIPKGVTPNETELKQVESMKKEYEIFINK